MVDEKMEYMVAEKMFSRLHTIRKKSENSTSKLK